MGGLDLSAVMEPDPERVTNGIKRARFTYVQAVAEASVGSDVQVVDRFAFLISGVVQGVHKYCKHTII